MSDDIIQNLGPLAPLAGKWKGKKGEDTAPGNNWEPKVTQFREEIEFKPFGPVLNHLQVLYGLRYSTTAWRLGEQSHFHEELGYWLWDPTEKQVLRCFMIPRGVTVLAGGTVEPDATSFELSANVTSDTYGICSNRYLDRQAKTVRYELKLTVDDDDSFSYEETTFLKIKYQGDLFHHTDKNTLKRVR